MIIDCDMCAMEGTDACAGCVVTALIDETTGPLRLVADEEEAIRNLSEAGLVAPIRLVPRVRDDHVGRHRSA